MFDLYEANPSLEKALSELPTRLSYFPKLLPLFNYITDTKGKRLRPRIFLGLASELGASTEALIPIAVAIELLHTASLIHDDLPALDNDSMRRGKASLHVAFGEGRALLTADLLISLNSELILSSEIDPNLASRIAVEISRGFSNVCYGQILDLEGADTQQALLNLHKFKTASLFEACIVSAAIAADKHDLDFFRKLGLSFGLCFQLIDDCLDRFATIKERGRGDRSDEKNHKRTFASNPEFGGWNLWLESKQQCSTLLDQLRNKQCAPITADYLTKILERMPREAESALCQN